MDGSAEKFGKSKSATGVTVTGGFGLTSTGTRDLTEDGAGSVQPAANMLQQMAASPNAGLLAAAAGMTGGGGQQSPLLHSGT